MKKILKIAILLFFCFWWATGFSPKLSSFLFKNKVIKDDYRYGDLYRMANLPQFKEEIKPCPNHPPLEEKPIAIHLAGDSFTEEGRIKKEDFTIKQLSRSHVSEPAFVTLDTSLTNILIIETVERHFKERFTSPWNNVYLDKRLEKNEEVSLKDNLLALKVPYHKDLHESVIFSSDFFMRFREIKALINLYVFNRTDNKVKLNKDKTAAFYALAYNEGPNSIFAPTVDGEIDKLVENVNSTYAFYKDKGFSEVYLSIIPNKATAVAKQDGEYNHLIERVQENANLNMPVLDMYKPLVSSKGAYYYKGDTHWNCQGKQIWTNKVNKVLKKF